MYALQFGPGSERLLSPQMILKEFIAQGWTEYGTVQAELRWLPSWGKKDEIRYKICHDLEIFFLTLIH